MFKNTYAKKRVSAQQNETLGAFFLKYAENIDQLDNIKEDIDKVCKIHVDRGVKPEHYKVSKG